MLGEVVRRRRRELGLTQSEASRRAGLAEATWRNVERGRHRPRADTVEAIAEILGLEPDALHGYAAVDVAEEAEIRNELHALVDQLSAEDLGGALWLLGRLTPIDLTDDNPDPRSADRGGRDLSEPPRP